MVKTNLSEQLSFDQAKIVLESEGEGETKSLHLNGICIQGDIRNQNQRIYSSFEIGKAVKTLNEQISGGYSVCGELDHPQDLKINRRSSFLVNYNIQCPYFPFCS